jgi:lipopolysaccharide export LptBFGC system permease protein LptF
MNVEVVEIMKSWKIASLLVSVTLILNLFSGCSSGSKTNTNANNTDSTSQSKKITDNKEVYAQDNDELENVYVTIVTENKVTMADVNAWEIDSGQPKPEINVRFDYDKPASDVTGVKANAVM